MGQGGRLSRCVLQNADVLGDGKRRFAPRCGKNTPEQGVFFFAYFRKKFPEWVGNLKKIREILKNIDTTVENRRKIVIE